MSQCPYCGRDTIKGYLDITWCDSCKRSTTKLQINLGPQPHLMDRKEYQMHMEHKAHIEKNADKIERIEERGPVEFRPSFEKKLH